MELAVRGTRTQSGMFIALEGEKLSWHLLRIIQDAIGRYEYRISQRPRLAFSAGGIGSLRGDLELSCIQGDRRLCMAQITLSVVFLRVFLSGNPGLWRLLQRRDASL
jgi:hypothetical protein